MRHARAHLDRLRGTVRLRVRVRVRVRARVRIGIRSGGGVTGRLKLASSWLSWATSLSYWLASLVESTTCLSAYVRVRVRLRLRDRLRVRVR